MNNSQYILDQIEREIYNLIYLYGVYREDIIIDMTSTLFSYLFADNVSSNITFYYEDTNTKQMLFGCELNIIYGNDHRYYRVSIKKDPIPIVDCLILGCPVCHKKVNFTDKFCSCCGVRLKGRYYD